MAGYNRTREVEELLERTENQPPSFTVHLHPEYWALNNGSKFLYNNHIASLLDDIRAHRIPVDFLELFDTARVPFYDGCMIVELLDYRPQRNKDWSPDKPERTRVVLHPDSETLWADICLLNKKHNLSWTDTDALEAEARILLATSPPLCLDPNPHLTRIANHVLRVSTPTVPISLKRKAAEMEREEDEVEKTRRHKLMSFMNPRPNAAHAPSYRILDAIQRFKQAKEAAPSQPQQSQSNMPIPNLSVTTAPASIPTPAPTALPPTLVPPQPAQPQSPEKRGMSIKVPERATGSNSPLPTAGTPLQPQHPQHPHVAQSAPSPVAASPSSQQSLPNGQFANGTERTPTPAQSQYTQSPRAPSTQPTIPVARPPSSQPIQPPRPQSRPQSQPQQPIVRPPTAQIPYPPGASGHFMQQSAAIRNMQTTKIPTPQPPNLTQTQVQQVASAQQLMYMHQQQYQQQQARLAAQQQAQQQQQNGRSTPQAAATRASPLVANQTLAARSPMSQAAQQLPMQPHLTQHPQQHLSIPQHLRQNPAFAAQLAAAAAANGGVRTSMSSLPPGAQQQQHMQAASQPGISVNISQAATNSQQQQAQAQQIPMMAYPQQMYNYAQMGIMRQAGVPAAYWMGRMPMVNGMANGQAIPGMPQGMAAPNGANPQALGVGKAGGPAGQGR